MRCHQCGQEVESNNRFCSFCGTEQLADAGEQIAAFDNANSQDLDDSQSEFFLDEDISYDDGDYLDRDIAYYSYHEKQPIRWWPIALALFSILLLVGVIIGIWLQFFSNDDKKIQFSDPTTPYKLENIKTTDLTNPQLSDRPNTDSIIETSTSTSTTSVTTSEPEETTTTSTSRSIDIVIVTDSETTSPTTSLSTTSISASSVESLTSHVGTIPSEEPTASLTISSTQTTTSITTMSETTTPSTSVEETTTTTPTYPMGFLSIDNVHMDMWPHVRLYYSYIAPQPPVSEPSDPTGDVNAPIISTTTSPSTTTPSTSLPIEEDPEVDMPAPFDVRFLSVWESESIDGVWVEQTVEEQKSTAKLLVVADTSKKLIDMVSLESLRHSINHLVESMDFPDESSERTGDALGLMQFSDTSTLLTPVTFEREEAINAINEMTQGANRSLLWNSLYLALSETPDKGAILLVTRGEDTGSIITPLYVRTMAQMKGIPIYTIYIKTEESEPIDERAEYFKTFSEITGGRCYVIDATNPDLDIGVGISMGLVTAYEGDRQNKHLSYSSTTRIDSPTRYVKLVYSPEDTEPIESEIVSYVIPEDAAYSANDHTSGRLSISLLHLHVSGERIE